LFSKVKVLLHRAFSYLPDFVILQLENLKGSLAWLQTLGIVSPGHDASAGEPQWLNVKSILCSCELLSADSSKAHQLLADAERNLESLISDKENADSSALEIFNVHGFGADGEWKKLDGTCLEKDDGEYVRYFFFSPSSISSYLTSIAIHMKFASSVKLNKSQIMVELRLALGQYSQRVICYGLPLTYRLSVLLFLGNLTLGTRHPMSRQGNQSTTRSKSTIMVPGAGMDPNVTSS
jgi:hypothetical protein